jgi:hypothetical protein
LNGCYKNLELQKATSSKRSPAPNLLCFRPLNVQKYSLETSFPHIRHW